MAKIDDLITKIAAQGTVIDGIDVLVQTLSDDLKRALNANPEMAAKIDAAFAAALANDEKLADAMLVNTDEEAGDEPAPPEEGKHNVELSFTSTGGSEALFRGILENNGVSEDRAAQLRSLYDTAKVAAEAQEAGGDQFDSAMTVTDNGKTETFTTTDEAKKSAVDVVVSEALYQAALAQNAEFNAPE